jgi:hypothetical protein
MAMVSMFLLALAGQTVLTPLPPQPPVPREVPMTREFVGPTPVENIWLRPGHKNSDDRMFPDIAIGQLQIDGDTLYVKLINRGHGATQAQTLVVARAEAGGVKSDLAQVRTGKLTAGESRWVPVKGFSFRTASTAESVFALANASVVSAAARLLPSTAGALDRSGQGCGDCTVEMDEANNVLTLAGDAIKHGRPE